MNGEKKIIALLLEQFAPCQGHLNRFFESDAEILEPVNGKLLFTTDEFSSEDFFFEGNPELLGWNLACCTISDVLASGGIPRYYAHALTLSSAWDEDYIRQFARGIAKALDHAGAGFIGGDLGVSGSWKYTGICLGHSTTPLTRKGAMPGDRIYITGEVGAGNILAALKLFSPDGDPASREAMGRIRFPLRMKEAMLIRKFAGCCIDTSDGVLNALNALSDINQTGYEVASIPYSPDGIEICNHLSKPVTFLFAGECGEYELLFTVNKKDEKEFLHWAARDNLQFTNIGVVSSQPDRVLLEGDKKLNFNDFDISARGYSNIREYLLELTKYIAYAQQPG